MRAARRLRKSGNSGRAKTPSMITGEIAATGRKDSVPGRGCRSNYLKGIGVGGEPHVHQW